MIETSPNSADPRIEAALQEYLEQLDRGAVVDREAFLTRYPEIADSLRNLIAAEEQLRKLAGDKASRESAGISTRTFASGGQETVPPRSQPDLASEAARSGLAGHFGRYKIIRTLGSGAMGTVYLAEDSQLQRHVAIKRPNFDDDPTGELLTRFYREARAAAALRHNNICTIFDVGEIDGKHFISMAYIEGKPLSDMIKSGKAQNERNIVIAVHKLACALQQAHDHGIVHRDLKPANIMIDKQGEPTIMDFGLARKRRAEGEATLTHSGVLLGSPAYMSPEQIEGDQDAVGPASDQYSLGVVLYEMLTGQLPFRGSVVNVLAQIITKGPISPSELRPGLDSRIETVCLQMMSKKASDRFPSMEAVAEELAVIVKNPAATPPTPEKSPPPNRPSEPTTTVDDGRASQTRKPVKEKTLTESDVTSLEELVRKCLRRRDYDQMIQIIERVPEDRRSEALQTLLVKAREKADEIAFLICEIDEADRLEDGQAALEKAEELLKIKPGHHRAKAIQEKYFGYGDGGAARIGALQQFTKPWSEGGWIPWSVLTFGLLIFASMYGVMVIYLGRTAIVVEIKDPSIEVAVKGTTLTITGPDKQSVKVEPGEQELKITAPGLETTTQRFSLKKGDKKTVTVAIVNKEIVARLENEILPLTPAHKETTSSQTAAEQRKTKPSTSNVPDRRAAEWVLLIGGTIKINENGYETEMKTEDKLPSGAFELTSVYLGGNPKVTIAGLSHFKDCTNLTRLDLNCTKVTDAGLSYFKDCKRIKDLSLWGTQVSDAGLAYFKDCKDLTSLCVSGTHVGDAGLELFKNCKSLTWLCIGNQVSDVGLSYFKDCKNFTGLDLGGAPEVTNAGLAYLKNCKELTFLILCGTLVTDDGLAYFKGCKKLDFLLLDGTRVTDTGMAFLKDCKNFKKLGLNNTQVTDTGLGYFKDCKWIESLGLSGTLAGDAGLAHFEDCRKLADLSLDNTQVTDVSLERLTGMGKLNSLSVRKTKVTEAGVKKLAAALPRCKIEWDGGTIAPRPGVAASGQPFESPGGSYSASVLNASADPDRRAAEWVLSIGGRSLVIEQDGEVRDVDRLPPGPFKLRKVDLYGNQKVSDAGLTCFKGCKNLKVLGLWETKVSDAGLFNFKDCQEIQELHLSGDKVTNVGLANFKDCKDLTVFGLAGTNATDRGLAYFKNCKNLQTLKLRFSARVSVNFPSFHGRVV